MATTLDELVVKLEADVSDLKTSLMGALAITADTTAKMQKAIDRMSNDSGKSFLSLNRIIETTMGVFGGEGLLHIVESATEKVADFFKELAVEGVRSAAESQENITRLNFALAQAGQFSQKTSSDMRGFAEELQRTTKFENDAIVKTMATVESLGRLDKEGLKTATRAALDLSTALGVDLSTATQLVGKAAAGEVGAFSRYGMVMTEGATKAETFKMAMDEINRRFGGAATSQIATYSGATAQLINNWGDFAKEAGKSVVENQAVIAVLKEANVILQELTEWVSENSSEIKTWVGEGLVAAADGITKLANGIDGYLIPAGRILAGIFNTIGQAIGATAAALVNLVNGNFAGASEIIKKFSDDVKNNFSGIGEKSSINTVFEKAADAATRLGNAAKDGMSSVNRGIASAAEPVNQMRSALDDLTAAQVRMGDAGKDLAKKLTEVNPQEAAKQQEELVKAQYDARLITLGDYQLEELNLLQQKYSAEQQMLDAALAQKKISEDTYNKSKEQLQKKHDTEAKILTSKQKVEDQKDLELKLGYTSQFFGNMSGLMRSKNKELFAIGKAAAIAQASIDSYAAIVKTMASVPYPFNIPLAIAQGVAGAVQVANIASTQPGFASGVDSVPGIGYQDNFPAILAPGERVVPRETNQDLKEFLKNNGGAQPAQVINVSVSAGHILGDKGELAHVIVDAINHGKFQMGLVPA